MRTASIPSLYISGLAFAWFSDAFSGVLHPHLSFWGLKPTCFWSYMGTIWHLEDLRHRAELLGFSTQDP